MKSYALKETGRRIVTGLAIGDKIAAGKVCLIKSADDIDSFEEGTILVTEMADPDWVPIMKKAKGIVTDYGGRTSHAAIVSRELGFVDHLAREMGKIAASQYPQPVIVRMSDFKTNEHADLIGGDSSNPAEAIRCWVFAVPPAITATLPARLCDGMPRDQTGARNPRPGKALTVICLGFAASAFETTTVKIPFSNFRAPDLNWKNFSGGSDI